MIDFSLLGNINFIGLQRNISLTISVHNFLYNQLVDNIPSEILKKFLKNKKKKCLLNILQIFYID